MKGVLSLFGQSPSMVEGDYPNTVFGVDEETRGQKGDEKSGMIKMATRRRRCLVHVIAIKGTTHKYFGVSKLKSV